VTAASVTLGNVSINREIRFVSLPSHAPFYLKLVRLFDQLLRRYHIFGYHPSVLQYAEDTKSSSSRRLLSPARNCHSSSTLSTTPLNQIPVFLLIDQRIFSTFRFFPISSDDSFIHDRPPKHVSTDAKYKPLGALVEHDPRFKSALLQGTPPGLCLVGDHSRIPFCSRRPLSARVVFSDSKPHFDRGFRPILHYPLTLLPLCFFLI